MNQASLSTKQERGVAAVEFALVSVVLITVLSAIVDGGTTMNASRTNADAVRAAARAGAQPCVGSVACTNGNADDSDARIIYALASHLNSQATNVQKVVIFKASATSDQPPAVCLTSTSGVSGQCNVYVNPVNGSSLTLGSGPAPWPSSSRQRSASAADYLGVYAVVKQRNPIGLVVRRSINLTSRAVFRLEPPALAASGIPALPVQPQTAFDWTWQDWTSGGGGGGSSSAVTAGNGAG